MTIEAAVSNTIKGLAMDAIQAANSGHPGMPMGMADIATVLWTRHLKHDPSAPDWADRDRVVVSNGHGSMLLYSMLFLSGTSLTLDDIKNFRQWGAKTAGHPEYGYAPGIETTTGPLGQGIANAVGMALAERWLNARFGDELVDHRTWVLIGDGCLMEGISHEAASLAGHLGLGRLIVLYDDNQITIDGSTSVAFTEDVAGRFAAYGWQTLSCDGHDQAAISAAIEQAKADTQRPTLISCRTVIGHGSPNKQGTSGVHGAPLGESEIRLTKQGLGMDPDAKFAVPDAVLAHVRSGNDERRAVREAWDARLAGHSLAAQWATWQAAPDLDSIQWPVFEPGSKIATRKSSETVLQALAASLGNLLGGSADLAGSNGSYVKGGGDVQKGQWGGRNLYFGVREHGMAAICNGLALHGGVVPYCATFMVFHDYMRPSVRLAALMHQQVTYVLTHDSIYLGEDGPTHQPIEHLWSMREIPGLWVARPADATECVEAWKLALGRRDGPTALCLTRQNLPTLDRVAMAPATHAARGGYVLAEADGDARVVLIASGSEVDLALDARKVLQQGGVPTRVVSMMCCEVFDVQSADYRASVLPAGVPRVSVEAGTTSGWRRYVGDSGASVGIDRFGASAPAEVLAEKFGFTVDNVVQTARSVL